MKSVQAGSSAVTCLLSHRGECISGLGLQACLQADGPPSHIRLEEQWVLICPMHCEWLHTTASLEDLNGRLIV